MPIIIFIFSLLASTAQSAEGLSCLGTPRVYDLEHTGEILFVKEALPAVEKRSNLFNYGIIYQNLFPYAEMQNLQRPTPTLRWGGYELSSANVQILKIEDATYPFSAEFTGTPPEIYAPVVNEYLKKLSQKRLYKVGTPALKVTYKYSVPVELCQINEPVMAKMNWPLPIDPYLAYFTVPEKDRVKLKHPLRGEALVNPCSGAEQIGYGGKVEPFGFWYFWAPWAKGTSVDNVKYDCTASMKEGLHWKDFLPSLKVKDTKAIEPRLSLFKEKQTPIKFTFLFGGVQYAIYKNYNTEEQAEIRSLIKEYLQPMDFGVARSKLPIQKGKFDPGVSSLLVFIWNLERNSVIKSYSMNVDATSIQVYLRGVFKLSRKPFEMRLHLSPNQPDQPGHDSFNNLMAHALINDDVVAYTGHAGWGTFLGPGLEAAKKKMGTTTSKLNYQLVAVFACAATLHYPISKFPTPQVAGFKRDFIQSVGSFTDGAYVGSTTLVGIIDQALYQDKWPAFRDWVKTAKFDNFLKYIPTENMP